MKPKDTADLGCVILNKGNSNMEAEVINVSQEISLLVEGLASCAIEGNKYAIKMLRLKESNFQGFLRKVIEDKLITI